MMSFACAAGRLAAATLVLLVLAPAPARGAEILPITRTETGTLSDAGNGHAAASMRALSADGRWQVFSSAANNLVPGVTDENGGSDVFLRDHQTGSTRLVTHRFDDPLRTAQAGASEVSISEDGAWIVFNSVSHDLVADYVDPRFIAGQKDLYLYEVATGSIRLLNRNRDVPSQAADGAVIGAAAISADGAWIAFSSSGNDLVGGYDDFAPGGGKIYLYDRAQDSFTLATRSNTFPDRTANGGSADVEISADGAYVSFLSLATNLAPSQADANAAADVFVYSRDTDSVALVSHAAGVGFQAGNGEATVARLSRDGSAVAYGADSSNLVAAQNDTNNVTDVFLWDRATNSNVLVSHLPGQPAAASAEDAGNPAIAPDGSHVAFTSTASQSFVAGAAPAGIVVQLFLYERAGGTIAMVSHAAGNPMQPGSGYSKLARFSDDGETLAMLTASANLLAGQVDGNNYGDPRQGDDIFLLDLDDDTLRLVSHRAGQPLTSGLFFSTMPSLDADASHVAYITSSPGMDAAAADANAYTDAFLWSAASDASTLASRRDAASSPLSMVGAQSIAVSADGRYFVFETLARNVASNVTDDNDKIDIYRYDRLDDSYDLVSHRFDDPLVTPGNDSVRPDISADGCRIVFESAATTLVASDLNSATDVFLWDCNTGSNTRVSHRFDNPAAGANGGSSDARISGDGNYAVYASVATDLVAGQVDAAGSNDVFVRDVASGTTLLASHAMGSTTTAGNGASGNARISDDGGVVAFESLATTLVSNSDANAATDVFAYERSSGNVVLVSRRLAPPSAAGNGASSGPRISGDGGWIAFTTQASNLLPGIFPTDENGESDVYLFDRAETSVRLVSHQAGEDAFTGNDASFGPSISADGTRVAFTSKASNLSDGQDDGNFADDVFVFERDTGSIALISAQAGSSTLAGSQESIEPAISADGSAVVFLSRAPELLSVAPPDNSRHVYLRPIGGSAALLLTRGSGGPFDYAALGGVTAQPNADGTVVAMLSSSPDLVAFDANLDNGPSGLNDLARSQDGYAFLRGLGQPVTAGPGNVTMQEDTVAGPLPFTLSDPDSPPAQITVQFSSSDAALFADGSIVADVSPPTLSLMPAPGASGFATITMIVSDADGNSASASFDVTVTPVNDAPQIAAPGDQSLTEGDATGLLDFTLADEDHALDGLLLSVEVEDDIVPPAGIQLSGTGANRQLRLTPLADASGSFVVTLRAEDPDGAVGEATFTLDIDGINDAPSFTAGGDVTVEEDSGAYAAAWAGEIDAGPFETSQLLEFEIVSVSDASLFASAPQVSDLGQLSFTPAADANGTATVEVRLADDGGTANGGVDVSPVASFDIAIESVNDDPVIDAAATLVVPENSAGTPLAIVLADTEDDAADLVLEFEAADPVLLPSLAASGGGASRTLTVTPATDAIGSTTLTLTVKDSDGGEMQRTVAVTVAPEDRIADLGAAVDDGRDAVKPGDTLLYLASVDNFGPGLARDVAIDDQASAQLVDAFWSCIGSNGASCLPNAGVGAVATVAQIPAGASVAINVSARVAAGPGPIDYTIVATPGAETADPDPDNNSATDSDVVELSIFADGFE